MSNPFEPHDIRHLSPSSCNTFLASPAMFVLQKCLKRATSVGPAAHRGNAVELGVIHGLYNRGADLQECTDIAVAKFDELTASMVRDDKWAKERNGIPGMVQQGVLELRPYGVPTSTQGRVSRKVEGLAVELMGFYDVEWAQHGILTDLKTSHALSSSIKINHARQVSLYQMERGGDISARLTYITPKKVATYALENADQHIKALEKIALTVQRFVALSADPMELASLVVPDLESFYFSDEESRQAAFEVWGL